MSDPISLPSLCGQDVNPLLCPVRALRIYLKRVEERRKGRKRLLILIQTRMGKKFHATQFLVGLCKPLSWHVEQTVWTKFN